ncbi:MAG TPA: pilus assembly protein TadG-related protein [Humisphaera sp.]
MLVLMTLAVVALLAGAALVVDGGNAWAQQRATQNASDAAAEAGAVVLAQNIGASLTGGTPTKTDADVAAAVNAAATNNSITSPATAWYTGIDGSRLNPAVQVGSLGGTAPPSGAYGVEVDGSKNFRTFLAGAVGLSQFSAGARATAVAGELTGFCQSTVCPLIPVTFPTTFTSCDGQNKLVVGQPGGPYQIQTGSLTPSNESILPLCGTGPGSVGWLAIQPEDSACGGGVADLACDISAPDAPAITFPIWIQTETGNTNSTQVNTAMNSWDGKVVYLPLFDCLEDNVGQLSPGPACPNPPQQVAGTNTYYHLIGAIGFMLDHAYINASNPECNQPPGSPFVGGNGATGCLKGWFVEPITQGPVGVPNPGRAPGPLGVQLIR